MSRRVVEKKATGKNVKKQRVVFDDEDDDEVKSERKDLNLLTDAYSDKTIAKYRKAVCDFLSWCQDQSISDISTYEELDEYLFDYIQDMYEAKVADPKAPGGKSKASATVSGIIMYLPRAKWELMTAAKAVRNWNKLAPAESYPPLTKELASLIAVKMLLDGHEAEAVGCLLAFDCLLRVDELASLRVSDVAYQDPRFPTEYKDMAIRLRKAKTGRNQSVVVRDKVVLELVKGWKSRLSNSTKDDFLFPFTTDRFRRVLKKTCAGLGLSSSYVPHSLRHGGATHMYMVEKMKVEDIMVFGRWAVLTSCKRYIQAGRALLLTVDVPSRVAQLAQDIASDVLGSFKAAKKSG